jgi:hypothetical protein
MLNRSHPVGGAVGSVVVSRFPWLSMPTHRVVDGQLSALMYHP